MSQVESAFFCRCSTIADFIRQRHSKTNDYKSQHAQRPEEPSHFPDICTRRLEKALFRLREVWHTTADTSE